MILSIIMSEKGCEYCYYFYSLVLVAELRELNVRNEVLDNIFYIYFESYLQNSFVVTRQVMLQNICLDYVLNNFRIMRNR